jgi:hypothetical protein
MIESLGFEVLALPRSPKWPRVRTEFLRGKRCECCGRTDNLTAHHIKPFHLFPELELDPPNLIALCEGGPWNCHFLCGHGGKSWAWYTPDPWFVIGMAKAFGDRVKRLAITGP